MMTSPFLPALVTSGIRRSLSCSDVAMSMRPAGATTTALPARRSVSSTMNLPGVSEAGFSARHETVTRGTGSLRGEPHEVAAVGLVEAEDGFNDQDCKCHHRAPEPAESELRPES